MALMKKDAPRGMFKIDKKEECSMTMNLLRCMHELTKKTHHISNVSVSNHQINGLPNISRR